MCENALTYRYSHYQVSKERANHLSAEKSPDIVTARAEKTTTASVNVSFFAQKKIAETMSGVGAGPRSDLRDLFVSIHPRGAAIEIFWRNKLSSRVHYTYPRQLPCHAKWHFKVRKTGLDRPPAESDREKIHEPDQNSCDFSRCDPNGYRSNKRVHFWYNCC